MPPTLAEIVENKRFEVAQRRNEGATVEALANKVELGNDSFLQALQPHRLNLITEIKPKSPSLGVLREQVALDDILSSYNRYAAAISVLTDKKYFEGSLQLLEEVVTKSHLPVLCKEFVIDPLQCYEARLAGAQAVLLMVKILNDEELSTLYSVVHELGMTAVVEVQTEEEMKRVYSIDPRVVLINNRDLGSFEIDLSTTERLMPLLPSDAVAISASGIQTGADIQRILPICKSFLIGSSLMQSENIDAKLLELFAAASPELRREGHEMAPRADANLLDLNSSEEQA